MNTRERLFRCFPDWTNPTYWMWAKVLDAILQKAMADMIKNK